MANDCYIHIGAEKCGSTTIQKSLEINHEYLKKNKILVPRGLGRNTGPLNHAKLVVASYRDNQKDDLTEIFYKNQKREDFLVDCLKSIKNKKNLIRDNNFSTILSAEHFSSRLRKENIGNFKKLVDQLSSNFKIILIIRNQMDWHISAYNTFIRCGGKKTFEEWIKVSLMQRSADWLLITSQWEKYFGFGNVFVLPLRDKSNNKSLDERFYDCCEINSEIIKNFKKPKKLNESLNIYLLEKIRIINEKMPWIINGAINQERTKAIQEEINLFEEKIKFNKEKIFNNYSNEKYINNELKEYVFNIYSESNSKLLKKYPHLEIEIKGF